MYLLTYSWFATIFISFVLEFWGQNFLQILEQSVLLGSYMANRKLILQENCLVVMPMGIVELDRCYLHGPYTSLRFWGH